MFAVDKCVVDRCCISMDGIRLVARPSLGMLVSLLLLLLLLWVDEGITLET